METKKKRRWETDLVFLLSVGALGCLVYYMNRPSYHNLDCISLSAVLLAAYLAQYGMDFVRKNGWENIARSTFYEAMRGGIGLICAASVLAMGTGNVLQFHRTVRSKKTSTTRQSLKILHSRWQPLCLQIRMHSV